MMASMCAAFSSTRTARDGAWSGTRCPRALSSTCSTSPRGSATSAPAARMAPSASAAERTAARNAYSASPRSRYSAGAPADTEYTVHDSAVGSGSNSDSSSEFVVLEVRDQSHRRGRIATDDDRLARGDRVALKLGAGRQPAHIAGHRQRYAERRHRTGRARRRAHRLQQRHRSRVVQVRPRQPGAAGRHGVICGYGMPWRPLRITRRGRRRARRRLRARRWPKPTGRHWGTT